MSEETKSHGELSGDMRSFRELVFRMLEDRERLNNERFHRVDERIGNLKEQTHAEFASTQKAVDKAEHSQQEYNTRSNEFRAALDDAQKNAVSVTRFDDFKKDFENYKSAQAIEIRSLRESRSSNDGQHSGTASAWAIVITVLGLVGGGGLIGWILLFWKKGI